MGGVSSARTTAQGSALTILVTFLMKSLKLSNL